MNGSIQGSVPNEAGGFNALVEATRAKYKQDKQTPFYINVNDGRLIPNTIAVRGHAHPTTGDIVPETRNADYVPYHGDPKASLEERMKWLRTANTAPRRVITSASVTEPERIDLDKMSKEQLENFMLTEFGMRPPKGADVRTLRKMILAANGTPAPEQAKPQVTSTDDAIG